jgi:predicted Zn-dependent protease
VTPIAIPRVVLLCALSGLAGGTVGCQSSAAFRARSSAQAFTSERSPDKLVDRGRAYASVGDTTRAEQYLAAAIDAGVDDRAVLSLLLQVCIEDGRYRMAIEYATRQLVKHPDDRRLRFVLGTLHEAVGDGEEAAKLLLEASSEVDDPDVEYALAVVLRDERRDPVGADAHFTRYLHLAPSGEHADEARASVLRRVQ